MKDERSEMKAGMITDNCGLPTGYCVLSTGYSSRLATAVLLIVLARRSPRRRGRDLDALEQKALADAVDRVAPSVVRIETVGGLERVDKVLFGAGPTTGLVVDSSGYILSSAFNFVNKPASILVRFPDGSRKPAKLVARDHNCQVVLLKIEPDRPHAGAGSGPAGRNARGAVVRGGGPHVRGAAAEHGRGHLERRRAASAARPCRPTPPPRPTTTAARWSTSAAA